MKNRKTKHKGLFSELKNDKENYIQLLAGGIIASTIVQSCTDPKMETPTVQSEINEQGEPLDSFYEDISAKNETNLSEQETSMDSSQEYTEEIVEDDIIEVQLETYSPSETPSSFEEAFAGARDQFGSTGIFEWEGESYSTLYEDELNQMTPDHYTLENQNYTSNDIAIENYDASSNETSEGFNSNEYESDLYQPSQVNENIATSDPLTNTENQESNLSNSTEIEQSISEYNTLENETPELSKESIDVSNVETSKPIEFNEFQSVESDYSNSYDENSTQEASLDNTSDEVNTETQSYNEEISKIDSKEQSTIDANEDETISLDSDSSIDNDVAIDLEEHNNASSTKSDFESIDLDNDGIIDLESNDFRSSTNNDFTSLDQDNDGIIDYQGQDSFAVTNSDIQSLDQNRDGIIDRDSHEYSSSNNSVSTIDQDNDGIIDFESNPETMASSGLDKDGDGIIDSQHEERNSDMNESNITEYSTPESEDILDENEDGIIDQDVEMYLNEELPLNELLEDPFNMGEFFETLIS